MGNLSWRVYPQFTKKPLFGGLKPKAERSNRLTLRTPLWTLWSVTGFGWIWYDTEKIIENFNIFEMRSYYISLQTSPTPWVENFTKQNAQSGRMIVKVWRSLQYYKLGLPFLLHLLQLARYLYCITPCLFVAALLSLQVPTPDPWKTPTPHHRWDRPGKTCANVGLLRKMVPVFSQRSSFRYPILESHRMFSSELFIKDSSTASFRSCL